MFGTSCCYRGNEKQQDGMFSYVSMEERAPQDHPLRPIRRLVEQILATMSKRFDEMYAENGRPSIPPKRLLRARLLRIFYSIRSFQRSRTSCPMVSWQHSCNLLR